MRDLTKVEVLRNSKQVVRLVYEFSDRLPDRERYGLRSQMERAAVSVAANIAEGYGRGLQATWSGSCESQQDPPPSSEFSWNWRPRCITSRATNSLQGSMASASNSPC